jgi:hypothetical protein
MTIVDTNQVAQVAQTVTAIQTQFNWPALMTGALWLRSDLAKVADYIESRGGIGWMIRKLIWNPPAKVIALLFLIVCCGCFVGCATKPKPEQLLCPNCHRPVVELLDHLRPNGGLISNGVGGWLPDWGWTCVPFNQVPAPENATVLMLGDSDLSKDIVRKSADGQTVRIHEGWVYRFYPDGGIDSITQLSNDPNLRFLQTH